GPLRYENGPASPVVVTVAAMPSSEPSKPTASPTAAEGNVKLSTWRTPNADSYRASAAISSAAVASGVLRQKEVANGFSFVMNTALKWPSWTPDGSVVDRKASVTMGRDGSLRLTSVYGTPSWVIAVSSASTVKSQLGLPVTTTNDCR